MDARSQEKMQRLQEALERGVVMLHLDARRPGVLVPEQFRQDFQLRLNISYRFEPADLTVGEWGVRETLSFQGRRFKVAVPWQAIFAITSGGTAEAAFIYPEDMPDELIEAAAKHHGLTGEEIEALKREASEMPTLSVVPSEEPPEGERPRFVPKLVKLDDEEPAPAEPALAPVVRLARAEVAPEADAEVGGAQVETEAGAQADEAPAEQSETVAPPADEPATEEPATDASPPPADDKAARRAHLRIVK